MIDKKTFITKNFSQTQKLGECFAEKVKEGAIVALYGDLGTGKTTFSQGLAKGLGIKRRIISPTFVIIKTYKIQSSTLYHLDLYRIGSEVDIKGLGIEEIITNPQNIIVIEWPEKMGKLLPENRWDIHFEYTEGDKRKIIVKKFSI